MFFNVRMLHPLHTYLQFRNKSEDATHINVNIFLYGIFSWGNTEEKCHFATMQSRHCRAGSNVNFIGLK